jgi:hypothetical protein
MKIPKEHETVMVTYKKNFFTGPYGDTVEKEK